MSISMVNNLQDAMTMDPIDDDFLFMDNTAAPQYFPLDTSQTSLETWVADYGHDHTSAMQSQPSQFGCHGEQKTNDFINFTLVPAPPTQWWYPGDGGAELDGVYSDSSPADGDPTPTVSSSSTAFGNPYHLWHDLTPPICNMAYTGMDSSAHMGGSAEMGPKFMVTETEPSVEPGWGDNPIFEPYVATYQSGSTQARRTPAGWTYRQILETIAFEPLGAPDLWHERISQLAADLGMPSGTTGEHIIMFVIHVAAMKNELDQVVPLVGALVGASRLVHSHTLIPRELRPLVATMYPDVARMLGFPEYIREASLNTVVQGQSDETSLASGKGKQPSDSLASPDGAKEEQANEAKAAKPARQRRVAEEDLYCRVGTCLESFKDSHACAKHRKCHFEQSWRCPGPCMTKKGKAGWFARKETLKRHLLFPRFADCKEAALKIVGLETVPESGTGWMAPFCERNERAWECPGFELTDLETVKGWLQDPNFRAPPVEPIRGRHRSK